MMRVLVVVALIAVSAGAAIPAGEPWRRPENGLAAAQCAMLFADNGDLEEAEFFASLAVQQDYHQPLGHIAHARIEMSKGHQVYSALERHARDHPETAPLAARLLLAGAGEHVARSGLEPWRLMPSVYTAVKLDPSLLPAAEEWVISVVRATITPANAESMLWFLAAVAPRSTVDRERNVVIRPVAPRLVRFQFEVAQRAMTEGHPSVAAIYAANALQYETAIRPRLAAILIRAAKEFMPKHPDLTHQALRLALVRNPERWYEEEVVWLLQATAGCDRPQFVEKYLQRFPRGRHVREARRLLRRPHAPCPPFRGAACPVGERSPFARAARHSEERFFPGATFGPPLPPALVPADYRERARDCRSFAPPLFPEPFDNHRIGVESVTEILDGPRDDSYVLERLEPCISSSVYHMDIDPTGRPRRFTVTHAQISGREGSDAEAIRIETERLRPVLMKRRYRPARIRGVPVWVRYGPAGVRRNCG